MWKNYLKIAHRNLARRKGYVLINITGLAVGMACCLLILLFVRDELSYDRFHEKADQIYRIVSEWENLSLPMTSWPVVENLESRFPSLEFTYFHRSEGVVQHEEQSFQEDQILHAPPSFFDIFSFDLERGNPSTALKEPYTALVTEETAEKYFGDEDPIGKTLRLYDLFDVEVAGVVEAAPRTSHFHYDLLVSFETLDAALDYKERVHWGNNGLYTYLHLPDDTDPEAFGAQLTSFFEERAGKDWNDASLLLQPLTDIHLRSHHDSELEANGNIAYVYTFSAVALFILLIACINFMNLSTARSAERAKEVGMRKTVGAQRRQLVGQFLAESVLLSMAALVLAAVLVALTLPAFRVLSGKPLGLEVLTSGFTLGTFVAVALVVGLLAGSYPAFVLSGFRPVAALRGQERGGVGSAALRKGLVVFQFAISTVLIVGTAVVYSQLGYLQEANLGFAKEQVLVVPARSDLINEGQTAFENALLQTPGVEHVTVSSEGLPSELTNGNSIRPVGTPVAEELSVRAVTVGHDFFETLGVEMAYGRSFARDFPADSSAFILNQRAARLLQSSFPDRIDSLGAVVGQEIDLSSERQGPIVGVAENFNMATLHESIEPIVFYFRPAWYDTYLIRAQPENMSSVLASLEEAWERIYPSHPLQYSFVDRAFEAQYRAEERLMQVFAIFAGLAIFIACLGLFGLAAYMTEQRTKEIGIRKVLGASVTSIVALLSKDFLKLVGLAVLIAAPVAYYVMQRWLEDFAYRIELSPWLFAGAGATALLIAFGTVSYQSIRAALMDPVKSLRYE